MSKLLTAGLTAFFVAISPVAYAQAQVLPPTSPDRLSVADLEKLTDARIEIVKAVLQFSPEQMQHWPAVENAIRTRAKNRLARLASIAETSSKRSDDSVIDILRNRNPVEFLNRRADALAQRSADLKRLAASWQPLYQTLTPEQRRRMAVLAIFVLREMSDALEQRRVQLEEEDD
jgi:hypothetical protein